VIRVALLSLLVFACGSVAEAAERLAVLELQAKALEADEILLLSDEVRGAVVRALGGKVQVMTRENMEVMLTDMGIDASCVAEGACEVETARNLGVDYVVSGTIVGMGGKQIASIKLHQTHSGTLLGAERATGADSLELLEALDATVGKLMATMGESAPVPAPAPEAVPAPPPSSPPASASFPPPDTGPLMTSELDPAVAAYCQEISGAGEDLPKSPTADQLALHSAWASGYDEVCKSSGWFIEQRTETVMNKSPSTTTMKMWQAPRSLALYEMGMPRNTSFTGYNGLFQWSWSSAIGPDIPADTPAYDPADTYRYMAPGDISGMSKPSRTTFAGQDAWAMDKQIKISPGKTMAVTHFYSIATGLSLGSASKMGKTNTNVEHTGWKEVDGVRMVPDSITTGKGPTYKTKSTATVLQFRLDPPDMPSFRLADLLRQKCDPNKSGELALVAAIQELERGPGKGDRQWEAKLSQVRKDILRLREGGTFPCKDKTP